MASTISEAHTPNTGGSRAKTTISGLKLLLNTTNECDFFKKRIKILESIQNHNQAKVRQFKLSLEKYEQVKADKENSNETKMQQIKKMKEMESEQKEINIKNKKENRNKISEVLREIEDERVRDRNKIREQSQNIAERIQKNREKQLMENRERRNRVIQIQKESKENLRTFFKEKKHDLTRRAQAELDELEEKKKQIETQLKNMSMIESAIINKQSQTRQEFNSVRSKLAEIYGVEKTDLIRHSMHSRPKPFRLKTEEFQTPKP